jgi:20S proteasome subunit beta 6
MVMLRRRRAFIITLCCTIAHCFVICHIDAQKFEPYRLNGGLVSAVAGKSFCVVACDTRMIDGYEIYSRRHIQSRLWAVTSTTSSFNFENGEGSSSIFRADGSVQVPLDSSQQLRQVPKVKLSQSPIFVASAGCNADCEGLKRTMRADARAAEYFKGSLSVEQVANLLSQILYRRRGFPFYSFCVVGGLTLQGDGAAYVYDALGSYERVAVATAGTGHELLQPILDRRFRTWQQPDRTLSGDEMGDGSTVVKNRWNPAVVGNQVDCDVDEAVSILIHAYRSVSEREIGVGDLMVLCVTERDGDGGTTCRVLAVPLKEH